MHIHVGHNIPGYLPEADVMCFDSVDDAIEALRHELKDLQDFYYEGCEATSPDQQEKGSECCGWCDVAGDVEASLSSIADGYVRYRLTERYQAVFVYSPPEGADMVYWAVVCPDDRECEIAREQGE